MVGNPLILSGKLNVPYKAPSFSLFLPLFHSLLLLICSNIFKSSVTELYGTTMYFFCSINRSSVFLREWILSGASSSIVVCLFSGTCKENLLSDCSCLYFNFHFHFQVSIFNAYCNSYFLLSSTGFGDELSGEYIIGFSHMLCDLIILTNSCKQMQCLFFFLAKVFLKSYPT